MKTQPSIHSLIVLVIVVTTLGAVRNRDGDWGFYAHRLINRMAVYTLPPQMMALYKPNIEYISEHAVDPDKRRYATPFEAMRHYIDLEPWGVYPYESLPREWWQAIMRHTQLTWISHHQDSLITQGEDIWQQYQNGEPFEVVLADHSIRLDKVQLTQLYQSFILPRFFDDVWAVPCDLLAAEFDWMDLPCIQVQITDSLTQHGILPYHLVAAQNMLRNAFIDHDVAGILRHSAEIGHYIGDAHVPLHTTENYNGQLTDQVGIHAFWESRIPELFAEAEYDFLVGKPSYISDPVTYYWDIVLASHQYVDSVLHIEKRLRTEFPADQQYCFDERLNHTVRTQCRAYARAYQQHMAGMVEERMRAAIQAIASAWYTAWIDAGQPKLGYEALTLLDTISTVTGQEDHKDPRRFSSKRKHE